LSGTIRFDAEQFIQCVSDSSTLRRFRISARAASQSAQRSGAAFAATEITPSARASGAMQVASSPLKMPNQDFAAR
jgi:hypothetical protein